MSNSLESDLAQMTRGLGKAELPPRTIMEDFTELEQSVMLLGNQVAAFKRKIKNLVGTP